MALDHQGRAWAAAVGAERWDEALQRVQDGRAGAWNATNRLGQNALTFAGRANRPDLVQALAERGARAVDPSGHALLDWLERGERTLLDAYLGALPPGTDPFPGLQETREDDGTPLLATALGHALNQGWLDLADRLVDQAPSLRPAPPEWSPTLVRAAQNAVFHDRPAVLAWLDRHTGLDWPALRCPSDVLAPRHDGNLLVLAGYNGATAVLPWLLDHGVDPSGDPPHANGSERSTARPWLVALDREATQRPGDQGWNDSWAAAWLDAWLADPRTHACLPLRSGRFDHDLLARLILRHDLPRIERVLAWHDFADPEQATLTAAFSARWAEPLAVGAGDPRVLDRVLQRTASWAPEHRQAVLHAAFQRWTRDGVPPPDDPAFQPNLDQRQALLHVLVQHGWTLNGEQAQAVWLNARRPLSSGAVLQPALAEGWSPVASARAWPSGEAYYTAMVMTALFVPHPSGGQPVNVAPLPDAERPVWASRWFGAQGWLREGLTADTWRSAWKDATGGSASSQRIDWAIAHLPDGVLDPAAAVEGLLRWSAHHTSDPDPADAVAQDATLERWMTRFAASIPADHPMVVRLLQHQVHEERAPWFERIVQAFPDAVRSVSPTVDNSPAMIHRLGELGALMNPESPFRGSLVHQWLDGLHQQRPRDSATDRQRRDAGMKGNRAGLVALLQHTGYRATHGWHLHRRDEGEPLLVYAARDQDWALVDLLRRGGADVNRADAKGRTALSWAIALHDKPASRRWEGYWTMAPDGSQDAWEAFDLKTVVSDLLAAGARVNVRVPGKDRTVERAMTTPRHEPWLRSDQKLWMAVERALMTQAMGTVTVPEGPTASDAPEPPRPALRRARL